MDLSPNKKILTSKDNAADLTSHGPRPLMRCRSDILRFFATPNTRLGNM